MKRSLLGLFSIILPLGLLFVGTNRANARDDDDGRGREHHDMKRVGTNDLQARSSYQPTVHRYSNNRWILFVGHHALGTNPVTGQQLPSFNRITGKNEPNGTSILDVSDPRRPKFLVHIPVGTPVTPPATRPMAAPSLSACATAARYRSATTRCTCCAGSPTLRTRSGT